MNYSRFNFLKKVHFCAVVLSSLALTLASARAGANDSETSDTNGGLTTEQVSDIDNQLEQLNLSRAQVLSPEENAKINRSPGIMPNATEDGTPQELGSLGATVNSPDEVRSEGDSGSESAR